MAQATIVLSCPNCPRTFRTGGETRPGARIRCPGCNEVFRFFVHGNGAVELRPVESRTDESGSGDVEPSAGSRLPPRLSEAEDSKGTRTIFKSRRRNRPIGGYAPFEKSRSYIAMFALVAVLAVGSLSAYVYSHFIARANEQMGKRVNGAMNDDIAARRKEVEKRRKKALENLKNQPIMKRPNGAPVPDGPKPGVKTQD